MITVTGASGFVGQALCTDFLARGHSVRAVVRSQDSLPQRIANGLEVVAVGEIGENTDWSEALVETDCVIHCAGRTHVMRETAVDALTAYRAVNVAGTRRLAEQACEFSVKRMIYISSIKVNGDQTPFSSCIKVSDHVAPEGPYGISKWEAENVLKGVAAQTGLEVVIVRPPLVYGPGVKGNFFRLLELIHRGLPLPLGAVNNRRSLVGLDNLIDLLVRCIDHPHAAGRTFLVSDDEDISTPELLRRMAAAMGRSARLFPFPVSFLRIAGLITGKIAEVDRLLGSLQVDSSNAHEVLGWTPSVSLDDGLKATAEWYLKQK